MAESLREQLGHGPNFRVRVTIIGALVSVIPLIGVAVLLPAPAREGLFWVYWAALAGCLLHLVWILFQFPVPGKRPPLLTRDLAMGWALFLPSLMTSFWPGMIGAPVFTVAVGATWIAERARTRSVTR